MPFYITSSFGAYPLQTKQYFLPYFVDSTGLEPIQAESKSAVLTITLRVFDPLFLK